MPNSKDSITNRNKILSCLFSATLAISVLLSGNSQAATREEVAAVKVEKAADFRYWNGDSPTLTRILFRLPGAWLSLTWTARFTVKQPRCISRKPCSFTALWRINPIRQTKKWQISQKRFSLKL